MKLLSLLHTVVSGIDSMNTAFVIATAHTCKISFIDRPINATLCEWLSGVGIRTFVTTQILRRIHKSWACHVKDILHSMYGGVTDFTTQMVVYTQNPGFAFHCVDHMFTQNTSNRIDDWLQTPTAPQGGAVGHPRQKRKRRRPSQKQSNESEITLQKEKRE